MFNKILEAYKNFEKITNTILKNGLKFCSHLCILGACILLTYLIIFHSPIVFYIGFYTFKLGLIFGIEFIICGFVADGIKKQAL